MKNITSKENLRFLAEKRYQYLSYPKQDAYKQLNTGRADIISLSCNNMQKIKSRIYNPDKQKTDLNRPLSNAEIELHQQMASMRYCLGHATQYPFEVVKEGRLLSQKELYRKGKPVHGLTTDSDFPIFGNTGFIFFNCFALGEKFDFSNRQEDLFFSDRCLMNEGYITLADGLGIHRTATYGADSKRVRADHGNTKEYVVTNGAQKMDYLFEEKETGKTSILPMTFQESHMFGPHIKEFLADIVILNPDFPLGTISNGFH